MIRIAEARLTASSITSSSIRLSLTGAQVGWTGLVAVAGKSGAEGGAQLLHRSLHVALELEAGSRQQGEQPGGTLGGVDDAALGASRLDDLDPGQRYDLEQGVTHQLGQPLALDVAADLLQQPRQVVEGETVEG